MTMSISMTVYQNGEEEEEEEEDDDDSDDNHGEIDDVDDRWW